MGILSWLRGAGTPILAEHEPAGPRTPFAAIDIQTTGPLPRRHRVVEIAVVRMDALGRVVDEWTTLIDPGTAVGPTQLHGITAAEVRGAPSFFEIIGDLTARLAGRVIVAHQADVALAFLAEAFVDAGWMLPHVPRVCTLDTSWTYRPGLQRRRLADCCWSAHIELDPNPSALGNARATADLFATYLHEGAAAQIGKLPARAATVAWPRIPVSARPATFRGPARPQAGAPGPLAALLDDLSLAAAIDEGAPDHARAYLEQLSQLLEDGVITTDDGTLAELAELHGLTEAERSEAHRGLMLALAHKAIVDGAHEAHDDLMATAWILGSAEDVVGKVLDEATAARVEQLAAPRRPLPRHWAHGTPLRVGQSVTLACTDTVDRARFEGRALTAGLRVTEVSRRTAALIADDPAAPHRRVVRARQLGVRLLTPAEFSVLLDHIQPAVPAEVPRAAVSGGRPQRSFPTPLAADAPTSSPTAVRRWARENGYAVGTRGRLPAQVRDAYLRALVDGPWAHSTPQ